MSAGAQEAIVLGAGATGVTHYTSSFFTDKGTDARHLRCYYFTASPRNTLENADRVRIVIPKQNASNLIDLHEMMLIVELELVNAPDEGHVSIVNNSALSLIKHLQMFAGKVLLNPRGNNYEYRAFIEAALSIPVEQKATVAKTAGWVSDTVGYFDDVGGNKGSASGFFRRRERFIAKKEKVVETPAVAATPETAAVPAGTKLVSYNSYTKTATYITPFITDFYGGDCELLNGVPLEFEFTLHAPEFVLCADAATKEKAAALGGLKYKLKRFDLQYMVCELKNEAASDIEHKLAKDAFLNEFRRRSVVTHTLNKGTTHCEFENPFSGEMPARAIAGLVRSDAFYGSLSHNPYEFVIDLGVGLAKLKKICCTLNGPPLDGLALDMLMYYRRLFRLTGYDRANQSHGINEDEFLNGMALFVFDFSTSLQAASDSINPAVRTGNARLELEFTQATEYDLTLVLFAEHPSRMTVNRDRKVEVDYVYS